MIDRFQLALMFLAHVDNHFLDYSRATYNCYIFDIMDL
jgi:hypothetical protein